jgi:hypothetical protein
MLWTILMACTTPDDTGSEAPPVRTDDSAEVCEGNNPEITSFTLGNGGIVDFDGTDFPTIQLQVEATDADGNLNQVVLEMWWEADGDGDIDTSGSPDNEYPATISSDGACEVFEASGSGKIALNLQVGSAIEANTPYDFAARIVDASGEVSEPMVASGVTPKMDGSDGDAE